MVPLHQIDSGTMALVVAGYEPQYSDPLTMNSGDALKIVQRRDEEWPGWGFCESQSGRRGWLPKKRIKIDGEAAVAQPKDVARDVTVMVGEVLRVESAHSRRAC